MTAVRVAIHTLVRTAVLAIGIVAYDRTYDQLITPTPGDADIGKGLIAFLLIAIVCGVWGLVDGLRHSPVLWALPWVLTGMALAAVLHESSDARPRRRTSTSPVSGLARSPSLSSTSGSTRRRSPDTSRRRRSPARVR